VTVLATLKHAQKAINQLQPLLQHDKKESLLAPQLTKKPLFSLLVSKEESLPKTIIWRRHLQVRVLLKGLKQFEICCLEMLD